MKTFSSTDRVEKVKELHGVKKERKSRNTIKRRKAKWISHVLRGNCLLEQVIEGEMKETRRERRIREQLLAVLQGKREGAAI
jgi:hypothetical protein